LNCYRSLQYAADAKVIIHQVEGIAVKKIEQKKDFFLTENDKIGIAYMDVDSFG
jgi:hypothetical protein